MSEPNIDSVNTYFMSLQDDIVRRLEAADGTTHFAREQIPGPGGGLSRPRVLEGGTEIEKAAVQFTHSVGAALPPAASERRPHLAGKPFQASAISLIVHPRNPYVPTTHANLRFFLVEGGGEDSWYFGGGFDLTPYYGFEEDAVHWHRTARAACDPYGTELYPEFKKTCDEYFFLEHRGEPRGIGGLFFDDFERGGFEHAFGLLRSIGDHFLPAYMPILERRRDTAYGEREREFQLYRRGRYVEFNLVYDRGTRFGLQAGARIESILVSMPPLASWRYDWRPEPGSAEERLYTDFLRPRDWLAGEPAAG